MSTDALVFTLKAVLRRMPLLIVVPARIAVLASAACQPTTPGVTAMKAALPSATSAQQESNPSTTETTAAPSTCSPSVVTTSECLPEAATTRNESVEHEVTRRERLSTNAVPSPLVVAQSKDGRQLYIDPYPLACGPEPRRLLRRDIDHTKDTVLFSGCEECSEKEEANFVARVAKRVKDLPKPNSLIARGTYEASGAFMVAPFVSLGSPMEGWFIDAGMEGDVLSFNLIHDDGRTVQLGTLPIENHCLEVEPGMEPYCRRYDQATIHDAFLTPHGERLVVVAAVYLSESHCGEGKVFSFEVQRPANERRTSE